MINNLPNQADYNRVAKQCLNQAFNIVYAFDKQLKENEGFVDADALWKFQSWDMNTSLILIHQAVESFMKGAICTASPLLLLDVKRHEWPTLPNSSDKDFNDLYTIGGQALINTYFSVVGTKHVSIHILDSFEEIRVLRNKIVHGVSKEEIYPSYLVSLILAVHTMFIGKGSWWDTTRKYQLKSPLAKAYESNYIELDLIHILDYVEGMLPKSLLPLHFKLSLKSRRYFCPWCYQNAMFFDQELYSKWALLMPQGKPQVKMVKCLCCDREHSVKRIACNNTLDKCKGDVIYEDNNEWIRCLTCGEIQNPN